MWDKDDSDDCRNLSYQKEHGNGDFTNSPGHKWLSIYWIFGRTIYDDSNKLNRRGRGC